jgi:hypothetical protein
MKRRERIEKGVYRSVSGAWEVAYTDARGKTVGPFKVDAKNLEHARKILAGYEAKVDTGADVAPTKVRFKVVAQQYLDSLKTKAENGKASHRTVENVEQRLTRHVLPRLGHLHVQAVRPREIRLLVQELQSAGLSDWTVRSVLATTSAVFGFAIRDEVVASNPCEALKGDKPAAKAKNPPRALTAEEVRDLVDSAPKRYRLLLATACFTGMRESEVFGLRWRDVDLEAGVLHVRHQLSRATEERPATLVPSRPRSRPATSPSPRASSASFGSTSWPPASPGTTTSSSRPRPASPSTSGTSRLAVSTRRPTGQA